MAVAASKGDEVSWVQVAVSDEAGDDAVGPMSANGCTWARGGGTVCGDVQGSGKKINSLHITRQMPGMICNYKGHWKVTNAAGKTIDSGSSSRSNCTPASAYFHWEVKKTYAKGTKVTLTWSREGGKDGAVAFKLKA